VVSWRPSCDLTLQNTALRSVQVPASPGASSSHYATSQGVPIRSRIRDERICAPNLPYLPPELHITRCSVNHKVKRVLRHRASIREAISVNFSWFSSSIPANSRLLTLEKSFTIKRKVKLPLCFNRAPRHEGVLGEWRCSSTHSLALALDGGEWSASRPGRERAPGIIG
jgi:hypothetical protein